MPLFVSLLPIPLVDLCLRYVEVLGQRLNLLLRPVDIPLELSLQDSPLAPVHSCHLTLSIRKYFITWRVLDGRIEFDRLLKTFLAKIVS